MRGRSTRRRRASTGAASRPRSTTTFAASRPFPARGAKWRSAARLERLKLLRSTLAEGDGEPGEILDDGLTVACGDGAVRLMEVQRAGGKPVTAEEFLRGAKSKKE